MKRVVEPIDLVKEIKELKRCSKLEKMLGVPAVVLSLILCLINVVISLIATTDLFIPFYIFFIPTISVSIVNQYQTKKKHILSKIENFCKRISKSKFAPKLFSDEYLEIVPGSLKIGEDLSSRNIIPIFIKGNYVIIRSPLDATICFQPDDQSKKHEVKSKYDEIFCELINNELTELYYMEPIDEDIQMLERVLPDFKEDVDTLKLKLLYDSNPKK